MAGHRAPEAWLVSPQVIGELIAAPVDVVAHALKTGDPSTGKHWGGRDRSLTKTQGVGHGHDRGPRRRRSEVGPVGAGCDKGQGTRSWSSITVIVFAVPAHRPHVRRRPFPNQAAPTQAVAACLASGAIHMLHLVDEGGAR
jgi:hypothetical protein